MKTILTGSVYRFLTLLALCLMQVVLFAQETQPSSGGGNSDGGSTVTTQTTTTTTTWYTQPWVWIVGGAVFILILIALLRGNSSTDKEVTKTTVIKDPGY